jgi:hypothetical protein
MTRPQVRLSNFDDLPEPVGLHDDGHVILSCSACGESLVDIWIVKKNAINPQTGKPFRWKGKAKCWACGDESFPVEWQGKFAPGHFGVDMENPDPDGMNDSKVTSVVTRIETVGDTLVFHTKKGT